MRETLNALLDPPPEPDRQECCPVRSVFISDLHFGGGYSQADRLLKCLSELQPEYVYLVGDVIDGWELRRRWHWTQELTQVLRLLVQLNKQGARVRYAIGNHDDFLRENAVLRELIDMTGVTVREEFTHITSDGRRFLVLHGDRFDNYARCSMAFEWLSSRAYNMLLTGNDVWHRCFGGRHGIVSERIKSSLHTVKRHVQDFHRILSEHARGRGFDGVICGHIHAPEHTILNGIEYCNTGDWLENCSAVIEHEDGSLNLRYAQQSGSTEQCSVVSS